MPTLGNALDFAKYEGRNFRGHQLGTAPSSPVTGQIYYNTGDNTLYWWDGTQWVSARGGATATPPATTSTLGTIQLAGDLTGSATSPQIASGAILIADLNSSLTFDSLATNRPPTGSVNMNGQRIINMLDPLASNEAATKNYVDNATQGMDPKNSVKCATVSNINLNAPGTSIDGITLVNGDRFLAKNQTLTQNNGIWIFNGSAAAATRALDMDSWTEVPGAFTFVEQGTQADTAWLCTADQGGTLNTTPITWTQFGTGTTYTQGTGITIAGNVVSLDSAYTDGRYWNSTGPDSATGLFTLSGGGSGLKIIDSILPQNTRVMSDRIGWYNAADTTWVAGMYLANDANLLMTIGYPTGTIKLDSPNVTVASDPDQPMEVATKQYVDTRDGVKSGYYSTATHSAGTTVTIPQATHGLRASRGIVVQVQTEATGVVELPDVAVAASGDVTVTFGASVTANTKRFTLVG